MKIFLFFNSILVVIYFQLLQRILYKTFRLILQKRHFSVSNFSQVSQFDISPAFRKRFCCLKCLECPVLVKLSLQVIQTLQSFFNY